MELLAIVAVVERGKAEKVVDQAREAGATGATILYGRGTGVYDTHKLFNLHIEASKEIILIITEQDKYLPIYNALVKAGQLEKPGLGIIFTVPIGNVIGYNQRMDGQNKKRSK